MKLYYLLLTFLIYGGCTDRSPQIEQHSTESAQLILTILEHTPHPNIDDLKPYTGLKVYFYNFNPLKNDKKDYGNPRGFDIASGSVILQSGKMYSYTATGTIDANGKYYLSIPYGLHYIYVTDGINTDKPSNTFFAFTSIRANNPIIEKQMVL